MNQVAGKRNGRVRNVESGDGNGPLMAGWQSSTLGDMCEMYQPKTISGKEMIKDGRYPVFGANGEIGRYDKFNHEERQLLITCRGATCGSVNISESKSWITGNAMVVRPKNGSIKMRFLEYLFRGGIDISRAITGAAQPQITRTNLAPLQICFPTSVDEQRRIVVILDEAFAGIAAARANAERNLRNARAVFESHLEAFFSRRGDDWIEERLAAIADPTCSLSYGIVQPGQEWPDGLPVVRPIDMTTKLIGLDGLKRVKPEVASAYKRTTLVGDELLLCVRGSTGVVAVASKELEGANVTRGIVPIRFNQSMVQQEFGYYLFRCSHTQNQIRAGTYGAALMQINIRDLRQLRLAFPPLREQARAVRKLDCLSKETKNLQTLYQRKLAALDELKKSLLDRAFSGRL